MCTLETRDVPLQLFTRSQFTCQCPGIKKQKNEAKQKMKCISVAHYNCIMKSIETEPAAYQEQFFNASICTVYKLQLVH